MSKTQYIAILSTLLLFVAMYFGCDTKSKDQRQTEQSRNMAIESTDVNALINEARGSLTPAQIAGLQALDAALAAADTAKKINLYQQISGKWYELGHPAIAGYYAQTLAEMQNTEESWSIAGTTYTLCLRQAEADKVRSFCTNRAVRAFENAISLNPDEPAHQVNLALCYAENPPQDNPMKGILMLIDLNKAQPDNVLVLNTLARLAIQTGQFDKALERLNRAVAIEPENSSTICLLGTAYREMGQAEQAAPFLEKCQALLQKSNERAVQ